MRTLLVLTLILFAGVVQAGGDCKGQSCNSGGGTTTTDVTTEVTNNVTGGDTSVVGGDTKLSSDSKTFAFSHSLGGVSIQDCLASTQWGTILFSKQKIVLNKWCAAEVYDAKGLHRMAALTRCDIEEIAKFFSSKKECIAANEISETNARQAEEVIQAQRAEIQALTGKVAEIEAEIEATPKRVVVQQEYLNAKKRAALRAVLEENE